MGTGVVEVGPARAGAVSSVRTNVGSGPAVTPGPAATPWVETASDGLTLNQGVLDAIKAVENAAVVAESSASLDAVESWHDAILDFGSEYFRHQIGLLVNLADDEVVDPNRALYEKDLIERLKPMLARFRVHVTKIAKTKDAKIQGAYVIANLEAMLLHYEPGVSKTVGEKNYHSKRLEVYLKKAKDIFEYNLDAINTNYRAEIHNMKLPNANIAAAISGLKSGFSAVLRGITSVKRNYESFPGDVGNEKRSVFENLLTLWVADLRDYLAKLGKLNGMDQTWVDAQYAALDKLLEGLSNSD